MNTAEIIGQIVKKKYPSYASMPDEHVGQAYMRKFNISGLQNKLQDVGSSLLEGAQNILSARGPITQGFMNYNPGIEKYSGGYNYGVDIGVPTGTKVATPGGRWKVVEVSDNGGFNRGYGNSVLVQNADTGEKLRYSHLSKILGLKPGQELSGQVFGETGATGNVTGPHLDLEYYDKLGKLGDVLKTAYGRGLNG